MALKQTLRDDLTASMRARDQLRTATLRLVLTAVHTEEVAGRQARTLSDDDVLAVLAREGKRRREAAEAYDGAHRPELAARERAEGEIIAGYLPAQLGDAELAALVATAMAESGATNMGPAMKAANAAARGRAEGSRIAAAVRQQLGRDS